MGHKKKKVKKPVDITNLRPRIEFKVFNNDVNALERAVKERLLYVKNAEGEFVPPPQALSQEFFNLTCSTVYKYFQKVVQYTAPLTKEAFLRAYGGRRRTIYENAYKSLAVKPFQKSDSYISYFTKVEKTNFTSKADPVVRGISPRSPRYHVLLGPYIKRIEHSVYNILSDLFGAVTVFKGLNMSARGRQMLDHWNSFNEPVAIGLDASRFDQHVGEFALRWEHSIYCLFYPKRKFFAKLLRMQLTNRGFGRADDGVVEFVLKAFRASGDMNTALGNCLLSCSMIYSYMEAKGIKKFRLANDGDDCVLFLERKQLHLISDLTEWFLNLGFSMKVEKPVFVFEEIEFCQAHPIRTPTGCIMVRSYPVSVAKDCFSIKPLNSEKLFRRWIAAVGVGGLSLVGGIPVVQDFYQCLVRNSQGARPLKGDPTQETGLQRLSVGMKREYSIVDPETRLSFWKAFGIDPARQLSIELSYRKSTVSYEAMFCPNDQFDIAF